MTFRLYALATAFPQQSPESNTLPFTGNIYDADSLINLAFVRISINNKQNLLSDFKGHFELQATPGDTVMFSAAGYETFSLEIGKGGNPGDTFYLEILMKAQAYDIPEARILPFASYDEFRTALINMDKDVGTANALWNLDLIMRQNNVNRGPDKDAYSIYSTLNRLYYNDNAFVFLSSEPNKGVFGLLRSWGIKMPWQQRK